MEGYWHSSPFSLQMSKCPTFSACDYTDRASAIGALHTTQLSVRDANLPMTSDSAIANCSAGYIGTLCAQCDTPGYGLRSSGLCTKCPPQGLNTLYYCLSYLLTIGLLVWTIRSTLTRSLGEARAALKVQRRTRSLRRQASADAEDLHHDDGGDDGEGAEEGEEEEVTTVARDLDLEYPALASSAVSTFVSLDCSLPDNGLSKAIQRTLINVCLPGIFVLLSVPGHDSHTDDGGDDLASAKEAAKAESAAAASSKLGTSTAAAVSDKDGGGDGLHGGPVRFRPYFATRMAVTLIAVIFYFYPSVTDEILSVLQCKEVDAGTGAYAEYSRAMGELDYDQRAGIRELGVLGKRCVARPGCGAWTHTGMYWEQDYGLRCFRDSHLVLALVVAIPGVVLFCVGVPVASAAFLRRNALRGRLNERKFSDRYGFLYEDYRRSYYYWESVIMLRKLCAVGLLILTSSQDDIIQVLSVLGVVVAALTAQVMCKPYVYERFNKLERASLVATSLILYLCCFFLVTNLSDTAREVLSVIIAIINVGMLVWFGYCLAVEAWRYAVRVLDADGDGKVTKGEVRMFLAQTLGAPLAKLLCRGERCPPSARAASRHDSGLYLLVLVDWD
eukprot:XP_001690149.1 predicted protein [Chlamydomonas reinhardtii]